MDDGFHEKPDEIGKKKFIQNRWHKQEGNNETLPICSGREYKT